VAGEPGAEGDERKQVRREADQPAEILCQAAGPAAPEESVMSENIPRPNQRTNLLALIRFSHGEKFCPRCKTIKLLEEFNRGRLSSHVQCYCKECEGKIGSAYDKKHSGRCRERHRINHHKTGRWNKLLKKHGLTKADWDAMLLAQDHKCAVCGRTDPVGNVGWHLDHDHLTGKVRGIVCLNCNSALGFVDDSVETLKRLIAYLEKYGG
jgi:hypothetical protein